MDLTTLTMTQLRALDAKLRNDWTTAHNNRRLVRAEIRRRVLAAAAAQKIGSMSEDEKDALREALS